MISLVFALVSLLGVIKSADYFVDQSISIAKKLKISSFVIGFTIVAFGTSLPELIISLYSTQIGHTAVTVSNVIGSNIANICLILGLLALYKPYRLSKSDVFYNIPLNFITLILFSIICYVFHWQISKSIGFLLLAIFLLSILLSKNNNHSVKVKTDVKFNIFTLLFSLGALILFGKTSVDNILLFSKSVGIEESILGYFIMAVGTSLPELVASFTAIRKGNSEVGLGNILGSNLFNLLFVLGSASMIKSIDLSFFIKEIIFLLIVTISLIILSLVGKKYYFTRLEGIVLLISYILFLVWQIT